MSKRSLFWGQASGKLGEAVYYRAGGEQRTRAYVANVKNPKTYKQMVNRLSMANLVSIYKNNKIVLSAAFPNKATNQSAWNAFVSSNKVMKDYAILPEDAALGGCVPAGAFIANGGLSISTALKLSVTDESLYSFAATGLQLTDELAYTSDTTSPTSFAAGSVLTNGQLWTLLHGDANPYSLPSTFKITVLFSNYGVPEGTGGNECWYLDIMQMECVEDGEETAWTSLKSYEINESTTHAAVVVSASDDPDEEGAYVTSIGFMSDSSETALQTSVCGFIISYSGTDGLECTSSRMYAGDSTNDIFTQFAVSGAVWNQVLDYYGYNADSSLATD